MAECYLVPLHINVKRDAIIHDFNDHTKTRDFLNHTIAEFVFIGPDRKIYELNDTGTYIRIAKEIQDSGLPNCKL